MLNFIPTLYAETSPVETIAGLPWDWVASAIVFIAVVIAFFFLRRFMGQPIPPRTEEPPAEAPAIPEARREVALEVPTEAAELAEIRADDQASWLQRLRQGLSKTRTHLKDNLSRLLGGQKLDEQTLEQVHEVLFRSDLGVETADYLVDILRKRFGGQSAAPEWSVISAELKQAVTASLQGMEDAALNTPAEGPFVILVVGVNGVGKTTSIGKLAARYVAEGKSVLLCAGDTFRAAAIEQLQVWGDRLNVPVIKHQQGADPASVAFDAVKAAKARGVDVLLIDTAGRLHNKTELMDELAKVKRVIAKEMPSAPHETWLVIDATTGQNAVQQVKAFGELVQLSGLVVTKLDGTAKGGVIIGIKQKFKLPIRYIGVGEKAKDLKEFSARDFAESLFA
ncbi:MAG TPA: signal recognition particle-docking protein FtsY [Oligoflexus sp.]|uniref:signal recognition particle-docking protein FtsY n=1 Tax=Oligoflexus sp. TaxID=1971216 RepID=UPI002D65BAD3|nr:signal recognition particle-docking protein FtsY [Oligoflexus sp.]HYX34098.1 signal recognition particle-docking protein FtsY [Oligoflexus sp.]